MSIFFLEFTIPRWKVIFRLQKKIKKECQNVSLLRHVLLFNKDLNSRVPQMSFERELNAVLRNRKK